jgi:hypothetical protein
MQLELPLRQQHMPARPSRLSTLCVSAARCLIPQARRVRDVEDAFERQREKERRAALEKAAEAERAYQKHVRAWEKEERCVAGTRYAAAVTGCMRPLVQS